MYCSHARLTHIVATFAPSAVATGWAGWWNIIWDDGDEADVQCEDSAFRCKWRMATETAAVKREPRQEAAARPAAKRARFGVDATGAILFDESSGSDGESEAASRQQPKPSTAQVG